MRDTALAKMTTERGDTLTAKPEIKHGRRNATLPYQPERRGNIPRRQDLCTCGFEDCRHIERDQRLILDNQN